MPTQKEVEAENKKLKREIEKLRKENEQLNDDDDRLVDILNCEHYNRVVAVEELKEAAEEFEAENEKLRNENEQLRAALKLFTKISEVSAMMAAMRE